MNFNYESTGRVLINGCGLISKTQFFYIRFKEGDIACEKWKAQHRGIIKKHVIKKVNVFTTPNTQAQIHVNYNDTLNAIWMDEELVSHQEALVLAESYLLKQEEWAIKLIEQQKCSINHIN